MWGQAPGPKSWLCCHGGLSPRSPSPPVAVCLCSPPCPWYWGGWPAGSRTRAPSVPPATPLPCRGWEPAGHGPRSRTLGRRPGLSGRHPPAWCQPLGWADGSRGVRDGSRASPSHRPSPCELVFSGGAGSLRELETPSPSHSCCVPVCRDGQVTGVGCVNQGRSEGLTGCRVGVTWQPPGPWLPRPAL